MKTFPWTPVALVLLAGAILWTHFDRSPGTPGTPDTTSLGRQYVPVLGRTYGEAYLAGRPLLLAGKPMTEVHEAIKAAWLVSLNKEFAQRVQPSFQSVVPETTENPTDQQRAILADQYRDFALGLGATLTPSAPAGRFSGPMTMFDLMVVVGITILGTVSILALVHQTTWYQNLQTPRRNP